MRFEFYTYSFIQILYADMHLTGGAVIFALKLNLNSCDIFHTLNRIYKRVSAGILKGRKSLSTSKEIGIQSLFKFIFKK